MTREFPDELLSAFLDNELSPAERAQVELHLAASPADRQLLEELSSLRGDVAALPAPQLSPDFADRVVRAAIAEAEQNNSARGIVSIAPPEEHAPFWRRKKLGAAAASALALAACLVLVVLLSRGGPGPQPADPGNPPSSVAAAPTTAAPTTAAAPVAAAAALALPQQLLAALAGNLPGESEAVILRLKASPDAPMAQALEAALAAAGLKAPVGSSAMSGPAVEQAYQQALNSATGPNASHAVFIDAPYDCVQKLADQLATAISDPLEFQASGKLALGRAWAEFRAEGESAAPPIAQQLNASLFKLQEAAQDVAQAATTSPPAAEIPPQRRIRVLLLVQPTSK